MILQQWLRRIEALRVLDVIVESCATKMFLANPDMDPLYRRQFHLNDTEIKLIASLIPKQQFLLKTPDLAKVSNLSVDRRSWLYAQRCLPQKKRGVAILRD